MVCVSIAFQALSYNFVSGSKDALAYSVDVVLAVIQIRVLTFLREAGGQTDECSKGSVWRKFADCFFGSIAFLQAKLPMASIPNWALGMALLFMELGGILGSGLILKCGKLRYRLVFFFMTLLVFAGVCLEYSALFSWW